MYLLSVLAVVLCFLLAAVMQPALGILEFLDVMSLAFLVVLIIPIMLSAGLLKDLNNAFRFVFGKKKEAVLLELKRAKLAVEVVMKTSIYSSVFVMLLQFEVLLHNMLEPSTLGPIISVVLLTLLYAMIVCILLLPIRARLEQQILEYMPSCGGKEEQEQSQEEQEQSQEEQEQSQEEQGREEQEQSQEEQSQEEQEQSQEEQGQEEQEKQEKQEQEEPGQEEPEKEEMRISR